MVTRKAIKILHIFGQMNHGGAEIRTLEIIRSLDWTCYQSDFCVLTGLPGTLDQEIRSLGGEIHYCALNKHFPIKFIRLLRSHEYDVVHSHVFLSSGFMLLLAFLAGIRIRVAHFRSSQAGLTRSSIRRVRDVVSRLLILLFSTHILAVSTAAMKGALGEYWSKVKKSQVIYNGIDINNYQVLQPYHIIQKNLNIPSDKHICLHIGRFNEPKNHSRLLSIFREIVNSRPSTLLLLAGVGPLQEYIKQQADLLGLKDLVYFLGIRNDIAEILAISDLLIFPSLWEGLPGVVLEATATGIPVLASDLDVIEEIRSYFPSISSLSLSEDDKEWARHVIRLLDHPPSPLPLERWESTPFTIRSNIQKLCAVWDEAEHHDRTT